jgi:hypothetical protein
MGILDKLLGRPKLTKMVIDAGQTFKMINGYQPVFHSWCGEIYESMLVRSAIDARARHISKLKVEFIDIDSALVKKLKLRPNPWDTWSQFLYRVSTILDCVNNCILVPIYDNKLNQIGFYPVLPSKCKIVEYKNELYLVYTFHSERKRGACKMSDCALLKKFQFKDDFFGESNDALSETMDLITIEKQGIKEAIKSTASYKFMANLANFSKMEDLKKERENFSEEAFGKEAKQKGGILLFPNTYKDVKQIDLKPYTPDKDQMDLINQNVYSYFGVNEDILQNKADGDTWGAFYEGAVETFAIQFSETMTSCMFTDKEIENGAKIVLSANRIQYMNFSDKLNYIQGMTDRGLLMIDEAREVFNLPPLPNGEGQRFPRRGEYHYNDEEDTQGV